MSATTLSRDCSRCRSPLELEDLRCAVCALPVPLHENASTNRAHATVLRCDGCGASLSYTVEVQAPKCAFCGSVAHVERPEDPIEEAGAYLPFRVDPGAAQAALGRWLGSLGWFRPSDLKTAATVSQLQPLWWVAWTFDVDALVSWTADSDHGSGRSSWAPHSGQSPLTLSNVVVSASRGLREDEAAALVRAYDLGTAQHEPHAMPGATIERFDVQRSAARRIITDAVERAAQGQASHWVPGSRLRNLHVAVLPQRLTTRRCAFPAYVLAYRYHDRLYRAVVHGQDPSGVLGEAPYSILKIALAIGGGIAAVLLIIALVALVAALGG